MLTVWISARFLNWAYSPQILPQSVKFLPRTYVKNKFLVKQIYGRKIYVRLKNEILSKISYSELFFGFKILVKRFFVRNLFGVEKIWVNQRGSIDDPSPMTYQILGLLGGPKRSPLRYQGRSHFYIAIYRVIKLNWNKFWPYYSGLGAPYEVR